MTRNVGTTFFPFERSRAYNLVQSRHIHIQISLCKPLYLRTFKRVFVCFLFRRMIMCAFDHISYYGQCNHFLHFLFHHLISNIQSENVGDERSVIQSTDTKMEIKRIPCPMLFASHSSQNHFINIYFRFVVLVCLCADWLYTYIFGCYCRCCHHHLIPSSSLLSSSLFRPLFAQRFDRHHTHKVNTSSRYKRHPKIENTQTLFDNIVYDVIEKMWKESMRCSRRPNKSLRDQLNSSLNDVDVFDDDNRYLYVCCVLLSSFLCRPVCYCFLFVISLLLASFGHCVFYSTKNGFIQQRTKIRLFDK